MAQFIRPDGDISTGNWTPTPVSDEIDEVTPSDSDFVESELDPSNDTFEVSLGNPGADPSTGTGTVRIRAQKRMSGGGSPGHIDHEVALYEGGTQRQGFTTIGSDISDAWTEYTAIITSGNMAAVTDWTDVRLRLRANKTSGNRDSYGNISWAEFEIPDAGGTAYTEDVAGSISFAGGFSKIGLFERAFAGAMTFAGGFSKAGTFIRAFAGSISFAGGFSKAATFVRSFVGAITFTGIESRIRLVVRVFAGAITFTGNFVKVSLFQRALAGAITFVGGFSKAGAFIRSFVGSISFAGGFTKATTFIRAFAGSISFSGLESRIKLITKAFAGAITFTGNFVKVSLFQRALAGSVSFVGGLAKAGTFARTFAGSISFVGGLAKVGTFARTFAGSLSFAGAFAKATTFRRAFAGAISWIGGLVELLIPGVESNLTHGPVLGDVTQTSIKIWVRLISTGLSFNVEYTKFADGFPGTVKVSANASGSKDNQIIYRLTGLEANTRYSYKINDGITTHGPYDFVTMPASREENFDIYVLTDLHPRDNILSINRKDPSFQNVLDKRNENPETPAYGIVLGDFFFNDTNVGDHTWWPTHLERYSAMPELFKYLPVDSTWDDHDFLGNNSYGLDPSPPVSREIAKTAWGIIAPKPDPDPNGGSGIQWFKVIGNALIICTDGRYNKEENPGTRSSDPGAFDEPYAYLNAKTWGDEQLQWIKQTIQDNESDTDFLFIISSTTVVDNLEAHTIRANSARDGLGLYSKNERNSLLKWIDESSRFNEVIFLTGDDHWFVVWEKKWVQDPQYNTGDPTLIYPRPRHYFKKLNVHELKQTIGDIQELGVESQGDAEFIADEALRGYTHIKIQTSIPRSYLDFAMYGRSRTSQDFNDTTEIFNKRIWSNPEIIDRVIPGNTYRDATNQIQLINDPSFEVGLPEDPGNWESSTRADPQNIPDAYHGSWIHDIEFTRAPGVAIGRFGQRWNLEPGTENDLHRIYFWVRCTVAMSSDDPAKYALDLVQCRVGLFPYGNPASLHIVSDSAQIEEVRLDYLDLTDGAEILSSSLGVPVKLDPVPPWKQFSFTVIPGRTDVLVWCLSDYIGPPLHPNPLWVTELQFDSFSMNRIGLR
jgi:hypothetical protein